MPWGCEWFFYFLCLVVCWLIESCGASLVLGLEAGRQSFGRQRATRQSSRRKIDRLEPIYHQQKDHPKRTCVESKKPQMVKIRREDP